MVKCTSFCLPANPDRRFPVAICRLKIAGFHANAAWWTQLNRMIQNILSCVWCVMFCWCRWISRLCVKMPWFITNQRQSTTKLLGNCYTLEWRSWARYENLKIQSNIPLFQYIHTITLFSDDRYIFFWSHSHWHSLRIK